MPRGRAWLAARRLFGGLAAVILGGRWRNPSLCPSPFVDLLGV